jgi:hypothetical protein
MLELVGCVPTLQDSDCQIELESSLCGHHDLLIQCRARNADDDDLSTVKKRSQSPKPKKAHLQNPPPKKALLHKPPRSSSPTPTIPSMRPPRRFKSSAPDREIDANFQGLSGDDRMFLRFHRQAACFDMAVSERRRESHRLEISKEDVKTIYESLQLLCRFQGRL